MAGCLIFSDISHGVMAMLCIVYGRGSLPSLLLNFLACVGTRYGGWGLGFPRAMVAFPSKHVVLEPRKGPFRGKEIQSPKRQRLDVRLEASVVKSEPPDVFWQNLQVPDDTIVKNERSPIDVATSGVEIHRFHT